jgi:hypothetical protein
LASQDLGGEEEDTTAYSPFPRGHHLYKPGTNKGRKPGGGKMGRHRTWSVLLFHHYQTEEGRRMVYKLGNGNIFDAI